MISDLKPYPAIKDSGVEWLGDVPEHWRVAPNRAFFDEIKDRNYPNEQMLSVTIKRGVIRQASLLEDTSKKDSSNLDRSNYKLVQPGDIAYNKMRAWQGAIGASSYRGIISPAYVVQRPRDGNEPGYFHKLFRIPSFAKEAERWSYGITSDMWSLRPEHFKLIYSCRPPVSEQAAIVRYLDHVNRRVRRLVRAKRNLIALLTEQKQAIIHRAVTRGLDPSVPLKNSGVEWLGEVPEHWEVLPIRRVTLSRCDGPFGSGLKSSHYSDDGIRVVRLKNIGHAEFRNSDAAFIDEDYYATLGDHSVVSMDLLIAGLGDERHPAGRACVAPKFIEPAMVKADCFRFRLDLGRCVPKFLALQLSSTAAVSSALLSRGATRQRTNLQSSASRQVALPKAEEQAAIVARIEEATANIDVAIARAKSEVELLNEYRGRLIADVVTGKLDAREAAAALPEIDRLDAGDTQEADENLDVGILEPES